MFKLIFCLVISLLITTTSYAAQIQTDPETGYPIYNGDFSLQQASPHVWYVRGNSGAAIEFGGFISNAAVVIGEEGVLVFDSLANPSLATRFVQEIRKITDKPIQKVFVSHYHADHIYGLQVFKDLGATIYAPEGVAAYLNSDNAKNLLKDRRKTLFPWVNEHTRLVEPDELIKASEEFTWSGLDFAVDLLGSVHSDADLTLLIKTDGVLLTGDMIFAGRIPFVGNADTRVWLEKLAYLKQIDVKTLIPGHGPLATDPNRLIALTFDYLTDLRRIMGEALDEMLPFDEAYAQADWSAYEKLPAFAAAHRRNVYQVYLALEAESFE